VADRIRAAGRGDPVGPSAGGPPVPGSFYSGPAASSRWSVTC